MEVSMMKKGSKKVTTLTVPLPSDARVSDEPDIDRAQKKKWLRHGEAFKLWGRGSGAFWAAVKDGRIKTK
jgi:hypothetical protein